MRLGEFQQRFQAAILEPDLAVIDPALGLALDPRSLGRIRIHHHHFWSRMLKFVRFRHPLLAKLLGRDELGRVVAAFITRQPPSTFVASQVPARLSRFLAVEPPWCTSPVVSALAEYDWHRAIVAASAEQVSISRAELDLLPDEARANLTLRLKKRAILLATPYRFADVRTPWVAPPARHPTYLLIEAARPDRELDRATFEALGVFARGGQLGDDPADVLVDALDRGLLVPVAA